MNTTATNKYENSKSDYLWIGLWILFGISLFVSKSGLSILSVLLLVSSLFRIQWKQTSLSNPWFTIILSLFPLSIFASALSLSGGEAIVHLLKSWPWILLVIPFSVLVIEKKHFKIFLWAMAVGLIVACIKSSQIFATTWGFKFNSQTRVDSYWDIGRWAYFLACSCVILFGIFGSNSFSAKATRFEKISIPFLFLLSLAFLILVNARGPWLAAVGGVGLLGISGKRYFKFLCAFLVLVVLSLSVVPGTMARLQSSFSAKTENGVVTSSDASNAGRLHMWKVNSDFFKEQVLFGTGFDSSEKPFREFLAKQSPDYISKYVDPEFSFNDQHSSYLFILVQMGAVFFLALWGVVAWIVIKAIPTFFKSEDTLMKTAFALTIVQLFMFIFYSAISGYEAIWFFSILWLLSQQTSQKVAAKLA